MDYNNAVEMVLVKEEPEDNENCPVKKELDSVLDSSIETTVKIKEENESNSIETYSIIEDIESTNQPDIQHIKKEAELEGIPNDDFNIECSQNIIDPTKIEEIEVGETFLTKQEDVSGGTDSKRIPEEAYAGTSRRSSNRTEIGSKRFNCELCKYSTSVKPHLRRHNQAVHLKMRNFKCELCDYKASTKQNLVNHNAAVHNCKYCDYTSSDISMIKTHIETVHYKNEKFKCEYCGYTGSKKYNLEKHIKAVHFKKGICESSGKPLGKQVEVVYLKKCEFCDYKSTTMEGIKRHTEAVHLKLKKYTCLLCDHTTYSEQSIEKHADVVHQKKNPIEGLK